MKSVTNDLLLVTSQATLVSLHVPPLAVTRTNCNWPFSASKVNPHPMYLDNCKSTAVSKVKEHSLLLLPRMCQLSYIILCL